MTTAFISEILPALTWTFIHSLWLGCILSILTGFVLLVTRHSTASRRYALLCSLFFLFLGSVFATFIIQLNNQIQHTSTIFTNLLLDNSFPDVLPLNDAIQKAIFFVNAHVLWILLIWFIVFLFKSNKMRRELNNINRLSRYHTNNVQENWMITVQSFAKKLSIKKTVSFVESSLIKVPVTIGHFKPLILVPMGMLNQLPPAQMEAVLLHELAHIKRFDYLVNFIQRLAELIFFFNPALLWLSSLLRIERENCCDEIAIAHTGNKLQFVEALIFCKEFSMRTPNYAIAFFGPKKLILHRLTRILSNNNKMLSRFEVGFIILSFLLLIGLIFGKGRTETTVTFLPPPPKVEQNNFPVDIDVKDARKIYVNELTKSSVHSNRMAVDIAQKISLDGSSQLEKDYKTALEEMKQPKQIEVDIMSN